MNDKREVWECRTCSPSCIYIAKPSNNSDQGRKPSGCIYGLSNSGVSSWKETTDKNYAAAEPKLPSFENVWHEVTGYVYSMQEAKRVYETIKKLGNFT